MTKWSEASKASCRAKHRMRRDIAPDRHLIMASMYEKGFVLREIGEQFGMTRERVRQILKYECGITASEGGQAEKSRTRAKELEAAFISRRGISKAFWRELRDIGRSMIAQGLSREATPIRAFVSQRRNARMRGIEWRLTISQWWEIWQRSGHWEERGRGHAYAMCRYGDKGPYAVNNVYIATNAQNIKHYYARKLAEAA